MIESGQRSATPETLIKIARALNCPIVALERKREPETASPADDSVSELEVRGEERARQDTVPELRDTAVVRAER
jgi:transcriptional regulator with XRE-family HTH domain